MPLRLKSHVRRERVASLVATLPSHYELIGDNFRLSTWGGDAIRATIADSYECPADLHLIDFHNCVRSATRDLFPSGPFDVETLESKLEGNIKNFRETPPAGYVAWARINFRPELTRRRRFLGGQVTLHRDVPRKLARSWRDPSEFSSSIQRDPDGGVVSVRGLFRSEGAAGYALSETLDRFVAFLNFWQNNPSGFTFPESARAVFRLGPTFNLYREEPASYGNSLWTNPDFDGGTWQRGSDKLKRFETSLEILHSVQRSRSRNPLFETAVRCMSLLNSGWTAREDQRWLMLVWTCFEKIFSTGPDGTRGGYATIARRAAKLDAEGPVREAVLLTLASHRNDAAHANDRSGNAYIAREVVSECSRYLLWLIRWMVGEGRRFRNKSEFLDWVDIPKDKERLLQRQRLHNMALTYWHPRDKAQVLERGQATPAITIIERRRADTGQA